MAEVQTAWTEAVALDLLPDEVRALVQDKLRLAQGVNKKAPDSDARTTKAKRVLKPKAQA